MIHFHNFLIIFEFLLISVFAVYDFTFEIKKKKVNTALLVINSVFASFFCIFECGDGAFARKVKNEKKSRQILS